MTENIVAIFVLVVVLLCWTVPFSALFGFFEDRKIGEYQFRVKRLFITLIILAAINVFGILAVCFDVANIAKSGEKIGEIALLKNRAAEKFSLDNEEQFFPTVFDEKTRSCWQAAFSNYVEDQWHKTYREVVCKKGPEFCSDNEQTVFSAFVKARRYEKYSEMGTDSLQGLSDTLGPVWVTAADMYGFLRQLFQAPGKDGQIPPPPSKEMLSEYHNYVSGCVSFKPLPWAELGHEVVNSRPHLCIGACP